MNFDEASNTHGRGTYTLLAESIRRKDTIWKITTQTKG
jgi:hypothetical protein